MTAPSLVRVATFPRLLWAARRAARGKRRSAETAGFLCEIESQLLRLQDELRSGVWAPGESRTFHIHDPKKRLISAAPFRDRVVHHALCREIEPTLERYAVYDSYACRRRKGVSAALDRAQVLSRRFRFALRLDVRRFFFTIDQERLLRRLCARLEDPGLHHLLERIVRVEVDDCAAGRGLPIGHLTSQHFANFYLGALDHYLLEKVKVGGYVRYMDDVIIFSDDKAKLWGARFAAAEYLEGELGQQLKDAATRVMPVTEGVPFLGLRIFPGLRRFDASHRARLRQRLVRLDRRVATGSLDEAAGARVAAGLLAYASLADTRTLLRKDRDRRRN